MKKIVTVGIVLVILGALALGFQAITYTDQKTIVDIGPITATAETEESIPIPRVLGALLVAGGLVSIVLGLKQ